MTLHPLPNHPSGASYVLKLHRDAMPRHGRLRGRLEHIVSGESHDFADADGLIAWLLQHAARQQPASLPPSTPENLE